MKKILNQKSLAISLIISLIVLQIAVVSANKNTEEIYGYQNTTQINQETNIANQTIKNTITGASITNLMTPTGRWLIFSLILSISLLITLIRKGALEDRTKMRNAEPAVRLANF